METGYTVDQVMTRNVLTAPPDSNIIECAKLMAAKELGSVVIVEGGKVIGILTEQDLARKVIAEGLDPKTTKVSDIMSREVETINPDEDIYYAMVEMGENKIKHLPVIQNGKLEGIVSFKDIIKIQPDLIDLVSFKSSMAVMNSKLDEEE